MLEAVTWSAPATLSVRGWVFLAGLASDRARPVSVALHDRENGRLVRLDCRVQADPEVNAATSEKVDQSWAAFGVDIDLAVAQVAPVAAGAEVRLDLVVEATTSEGTFTGPFLRRNDGGSAGCLTAQALPDGRHATPRWSAEAGLSIVVSRPPVVAATAGPVEGGVRVAISATEGFAPVRAVLRGPAQAPVTAALSADATSVELLVDRDEVAKLRRRSRTWALDLVDADGRVEVVRWAGASVGDRVAIAAGVALEISQGRTVRVVCDPRGVLVTDVDHVMGPEPGLRLRGWCSALPGTVLTGELAGPRVATRGRAAAVAEDGSFDLVVPLVTVRADGDPLPVPAGRYSLLVHDPSAGPLVPRASAACTGPFDRRQHSSWCNCRITRRDARFAVEISAPLAADEIGPFHQGRLRAEAARRKGGQLQGSYFESWFGRNVSDNPIAVYREVLARGVGAPYSWGVTDMSVSVPEGAEPVVVGTRRWWQVSTTAQYVIINFWQRPDFLKRPGQVVVQTWHGTPYKLLGLDRPTKSGRPGSIRKIERDIRAWDHLVSQNPHTTEVLRRAYLWQRPVLEIGYPRDDAAAVGDPALRARVRAGLGLPDDEVVVLYAPTWREDNRSKVGVLDLDRVAAAIGPGFRLLVRGHATSLRSGAALTAQGIIDVTTYPDVADLIVASDLLVTDYSSIMFDYSVTGRPILFYVPDLDDYAGTRRAGPPWRRRVLDPAKARGVYFDLAEVAPGPLLTRESDLVAAIRGHQDLVARYAAAYAAWRARFNPHDDGRASARLVEAVYGA